MATTLTDRQNTTTGLAIKVPVKAATTGNITLSGEQTIDEISIDNGDRVLVKNQTTGSENGIYVASDAGWERAGDFDGNFDVVKGMVVRVNSGTVNGRSYFEVSTSDPITIGTTSISFTLVQPFDSSQSVPSDGTDATDELETYLTNTGHKISLGDGRYELSGFDFPNRSWIDGTGTPVYNNIANATAGTGTILRGTASATEVIDATDQGNNHFGISNLLIDGRSLQSDYGIKTGASSDNDMNLTVWNITTTQNKVGIGQGSSLSDSVVGINVTSFNDQWALRRPSDCVYIGCRAISNYLGGLDYVGGSGSTYWSGRIAHCGNSSNVTTNSEGHGINANTASLNWWQVFLMDRNFKYGFRGVSVDHSMLEGIFNRNGANNGDTSGTDDIGQIYLKNCSEMLIRGITRHGTADGGSGNDTPKYCVVYDIAGGASYNVKLDLTWDGYTVKPFGVQNGSASILSVGSRIDERLIIDGPGAPVYWRRTGTIATAGNAVIRFYLPKNWDTLTAIGGRLQIVLRRVDSSAEKNYAVIDWMLDNFSGSPVFTPFTAIDYSSGVIGTSGVTLGWGTPTDGSSAGETLHTYIDLTITNAHASRSYEAFCRMVARAV